MKIYGKSKILLAIVVIYMVFLTACSSTGTNKKADENTSTKDEITTNNNSASSDEEQQEVTLKFWYTANEADETDVYAAWMNENIKLFEEQNPNIKIEPSVTGNGEEYLTKVTADVASGNVPDIFQTWLTGRLKPFVEAGRVAPLNDAVAGSEELSKNISDIAKTFSMYGDEKFYAIPLVASGEVVFYNKAIFSKYNLEVPTTWDEFMNVCNVLKDNGETPIAMSGGDAWVTSIPYMTLFQRMNGSAMYEEVIVNNQAKFDDTVFTEVAEKYRQLFDVSFYNNNYKSAVYDEATTLFKTGKAAMIFDGTWSSSAYIQNLGEDIGVFNFPNENGPSNDFLMNYDTAFSISATTEYPEEAALFLSFIFSKERQAVYAEEGNLIACVNIPVDESKIDPLIIAISDLFASAENTQIPWDNPLGTNIGNEFNLTIQSILGGGDIAPAFKNLQSLAADEWN
jgi:raffinose/stachyose/melibiose transport system substrate-binding protein